MSCSKTLTGTPLSFYSKNPNRSQFLYHRRPNSPCFFTFPPKSTTVSHITPLKYQFGNPERDGETAMNGIHVPRQKYISVSKAKLLEAILTMFESEEDADEFVRFSVCLDSILHAEHKGMLEKMRMYYSLTQSVEATTDCSTRQSMPAERPPSMGHKYFAHDGSTNGTGNKVENFGGKKEDDKPPYFNNSLDLRKLFGSFASITSSNSFVKSRVAMAPDFQQSFMKLLHDAQFEELSAQDLVLTYALNNDYLLTLPIYVDWKRASESNAVIFRRGYTTERQRGILIVEKLDYLQSKLLQEIFFGLSRPLKAIGSWLNKAMQSSEEGQKLEKWIEKVKIWLKEQYSLDRKFSFVEDTSGNQLSHDQISDSDLPIWIAAQKAIPRYEGFLSSVGPRGRLIRKLLNKIGLLPSMSEAAVNLDSDSTLAEPYLRPNFLPRITLSNIWEPANRESCGNNIWKMLKASVSILFSQSTLQL